MIQADAFTTVVEFPAIRAEERHGGRNIEPRAERDGSRSICRIEIYQQGEAVGRQGDARRQVQVNPAAEMPGIRGVRWIEKFHGHAGDVCELDVFVHVVVHTARQVHRAIVDLTDDDRSDFRSGVGPAECSGTLGGKEDVGLAVEVATEGDTRGGSTERVAVEVTGEIHAVARVEINLVAPGTEREGGRRPELIEVSFAKHQVTARGNDRSRRDEEFLRSELIIGQPPTREADGVAGGIVELDPIDIWEVSVG